ncbi:hypothetical protein [Thermoactinospora rubra]|uniref:hypothetical protein n=1 Tax=Thermoactinospora rubra TaxID=1088767 RepID=UPI0011816DAA|nr:hypothetical protein [Thermoactinospora rubra]
MTSTAMTVPYVIAWSGEAVPHRLVFVPHRASGGLRLDYPDPLPDDRVNDLLWARVKLNRRGEPMWRLLNSRRQRRCMERHLCQVCGRPAGDLETGRTWWVITETAFRAIGDDGGLTNAPPTCPRCIPESLRWCPQLRKSATVYTATRAEPAGVLAEVFEPSLGGVALPVGHNEFVGFDEFARHPFVLATQLVVQLSGMQPEPIP